MKKHINDIKLFQKRSREVSRWSFDLEATSLDPFAADAVTLTAALASSEDEVFGFVLDHPLDTETSDTEYEARVNAIHECVLGDAGKEVIGHNVSSYDAFWWSIQYSQPVLAELRDTRITWNLIDENSPNSLDYLARTLTRFTKNEGGLNRKKLATYPPLEVLEYNMMDAIISYATWSPVEKLLREEDGEKLHDLLSEVARVLLRMTIRGAYIDQDFLEKQAEAIQSDLETRERVLRKVLGDINLNSSQQLAKVLYDELKLPVLTRSQKTDAASTSHEAIQTLIFQGDIDQPTKRFLKALEDYRETYRLKNTYLNKYRTKHVKPTGRIHTTFNMGRSQAFSAKQSSGTVTGRLSSSNPNLQNLPRDSRIRGVIAPSPGLLMGEGDYSQLELRILGWDSGDPVMLNAFEIGQDLHTLTAAMIASKPYDVVADYLTSDDSSKVRFWGEKRTQGKRVNFGIPYGISSYGLMLQLWDSGVASTQQEAGKLLRNWSHQYTVANQYLEDTRDKAIKDGVLINPIGRRRRLPGASRMTPEGRRILRQAVNFRIQSFASDVTLIALYLLALRFAEEGYAWLILTVHDSIMWEYDPNHWTPERMAAVVREEMVDNTVAFLEDNFGVRFSILEADIKVGLERWAK